MDSPRLLSVVTLKRLGQRGCRFSFALIDRVFWRPAGMPAFFNSRDSRRVPKVRLESSKIWAARCSVCCLSFSLPVASGRLAHA